MSRKLAVALAVSAAIATAGSLVSMVPGQAQAQTGQAAAINNLPPALRAAVLSGNGAQIQQAIQALSGGNPAQAGSLAASVVQVAEGLLSTNPQAAIAAGGAAVAVARALPQGSAPQQTETVITTAARLFVAPAAQSLSTQAAGLASATLALATQNGNPTLTANVANNAVSAAERILSVDPAGAVQLAASATSAANSPAVMAANPQAVSATMTTASRIVVAPEAQRVAPQQVASISVSVSQAVSNPAVYQVSPQAAINVMANAYSAANSASVQAAAPATAATVTQTLTQASSNNSLNQANQTNSAQVQQILAGQRPPVQQQQQQQQQAQTQTQTQTPPVVFERPISSASPT